jgi:hypothetical protein
VYGPVPDTAEIKVFDGTPVPDIVYPTNGVTILALLSTTPVIVTVLVPDVPSADLVPEKESNTVEFVNPDQEVYF